MQYHLYGGVDSNIYKNHVVFLHPNMPHISGLVTEVISTMMGFPLDQSDNNIYIVTVQV